MPAIEIASIGSTALHLEQDNFAYAIIEEKVSVSHRSHFQKLFRKEKGVMVHIGNPGMNRRRQGGSFSGQLIDWRSEECVTCLPVSSCGKAVDQQYRFRFLAQHKSQLDFLLRIALAGSPVRKSYVLADYQFGPTTPPVQITYTSSACCKEQDNNGCRFNTLYEMHGG
jgi:hypothetical protein